MYGRYGSLGRSRDLGMDILDTQISGIREVRIHTPESADTPLGLDIHYD